MTPQLQLIYETESTRRCPVRDVAFFAGSDQVAIVGQEGITFVVDGERSDHPTPEPLYALQRDGSDLVSFGRYGLIARLRDGGGDDPASVTIEAEHLSPPRSYLYALQREGDVLRAISPGSVLRREEGQWSTEARGYAPVVDIVGQQLMDEMTDARHYGRVHDSESSAMAEFSEDAVTFRGFGAERTLALPDALRGVPNTERGGAFSGGHFATWSGRNVGLLEAGRWQVFEMPTDVNGVVSTPTKPLLVHGCQHVWLATPSE
ncbi:MAG: hypothetical protein AB8H86_33240 [Polyangiales bacterium]